MFSVDIKNEDGKVEVRGVISKDLIKSKRDVVIHHLTKNKKVDGFREGKVPKDILEKDIDEMEVVKQSAHEIFLEKFPETLAKEKLTPINRPSLEFTKLSVDSDVEFKASFEVIQKIDITGYKEKIKEVGLPEKIEITTDIDVNKALLDIRRDIYRKNNKDKELPKDEDLPELKDEEIKEISSSKNIEEFREHIKKSIQTQKESQQKHKHRDKIIQKLISTTEVKVPASLVDSQTERAFKEMEMNAERLGTTVQAYIESRKITIDDLKKELRTDSEKRVKLQLILNEISKKENIFVEEDLLEKEVQRMKERAKGVSETEVRMYIESMLTNEKIMNHLEKVAIE